MQPNLIHSIRGFVSGVLLHTQQGLCLCSSAVVVGGEGYSAGGYSCALSLLSETREDWLCWYINCLDRNTVRDHKAPGGIRLPLSTNMLATRILASRKWLTLLASRNVVCSSAQRDSSSSLSNKVIYLVLYSPIVFIPL